MGLSVLLENKSVNLLKPSVIEILKRFEENADLFSGLERSDSALSVIGFVRFGSDSNVLGSFFGYESLKKLFT